MYGPDARQRPPNYELFFAPLVVRLKPGVSEDIQFAYRTSKAGHAKEKRDDGSRYFDHPKAVAWIYINELDGRDPRVIIGALLHDIRENSRLLSSWRISLNLGEDIALDVTAVTKLPKGKETTLQYIYRIIARGAWAILIKLCDRLHNVRTLNACPMEKRIKYVAETEEYHLPVLVPALRECGGQYAEYADMLEEKIRKALSEVILS